MPAITREEVAHLARLARIDLTEAELDQLAPQLDVILTSVAQVSEVAARGHSADLARGAAHERLPRGRGRALPAVDEACGRAAAARRRSRTGGSASRASSEEEA